MAGNLERRLTVKMSADGVGDVTAALKRVAGSVTGVGRGLDDIKAAASAARSSLAAIGSAAKSIGKIGAAAGAGMTAAGGGLLALTRQVTSDVAERQKLATQLGLSFENYQSLSALAQKYGIEYADMQGFLVNLTDKAYDAAINANETAAGDLAALGVSAVNANGELKTTWELIQSIFDGVSKMQDGSAKAGALSIVAGDEGPKWINILNEGSAALERQPPVSGKLSRSLDLKLYDLRGEMGWRRGVFNREEGGGSDEDAAAEQRAARAAGERGRDQPGHAREMAGRGAGEGAVSARCQCRP